MLGVFLTAAVLAVGAPLAHAVSYEAQIKALQDQNKTTQAQKQVLQQQAATLSGHIAELNALMSVIEGLIADNQTKRDKLAAEIIQAEADIAQQRTVLGENIRKVYVESDMSTLEMLATSNDLSHYVDKEQYQVSLQKQVEDTLKRINTLKKQLDDQKAEVDQLLADQQAAQDQLQGVRAEVNRLLSLNQAEQAAYEKNIKVNNSQIAELQRKQAIENARYNVGTAVKGGTGGYPYANAPFPNTIVDPWGMYKRQCVSYTAWKVASTGRHMPYWGGHGNANQWDENARADGIPVDSNPRVGDVAVSNSGTYGHVMYVESVHDDGTITVSQYNASWDGEYSVVKRSTVGLVFIHF